MDKMSTNARFMQNALTSLNQRSPYTTNLGGLEPAFQQWVRQNNIPYDLNTPATAQDYDMRGFYQGLISGDPRAITGINAFDNQLHYGDTWKTPLHHSFSNESMYATPSAPQWQQDARGWMLVNNAGQILVDERK
jgi:hypothetical protein